MNHSLENIFKAITPDSIKNIPVVQDAMKIFVEVLEEKSKASIDIRNILNENSPEIIKDELVKIYLNDIYRVLNIVQRNKQIAEKIERYNQQYGSEYIKKDIIGTISNVLNYEHYFTTRDYKQKKGTVQGIKYIYDMIENIITSGEEKYDIVVVEKEPFHLKIEGSMLKELYDNIVRPLAHPLGFVYTYVNIVKIYFEDNFNLIHHYTNSTVEVRCLYGNVDSYSHKKIIDVREEIISRKKVLKVSFEDNSRLEQWFEPIVVKYFENDILVKEYPEEGHCSIYVEYELEIELLTRDEISFKESKGLDDDYFEIEGECDLIGNPNIIIGQAILGNDITIANELDDLIIGKFVIGRKRRDVKDEVNFRETLDITKSYQPYEVFLEQGSYVINEFNVGEVSEKRIGGSLFSVNAGTSEIYDLRVQVKEDLEISEANYMIDEHYNINDELNISQDQSFNDDYFNIEGESPIIGNPNIIIGQAILGNDITIANELDDLTIGKFVIGMKQRDVKDKVFFRETLDITKGNYTYQLYLEQGSYKIDEFDVGEDSEHRIGCSLITVDTDTSEFYDLRQVKEEFDIELI